jgi:lysylphosphatidylglycerol synthetase-like protein (DUF2156 family)
VKHAVRLEREPTSVVGRWAPLRLALGIAQMLGAILGIVLLISAGLSWETVVVAAVTTSLTIVSRRLFPRNARHGSATRRTS